MTDARTFPVDLDQTRQLRFNTTSLRLLDRELTQLGYGSFASCVQGLVESMEGADGDYGEIDLTGVNNDVMALALKYGLRHSMPGIQDHKVDDMVDAVRDDPDKSIIEVWGRVVEAWVEGSPFGVEEVEEEAGAEGNAPSGTSSDPYSDAEKGQTRATSARASTG